MTGLMPLDWSLVAVSVFNTILLFSLALTVLLNAERRAWAVWMMFGGLMMGAAFFFSHTAILGHELIFTRGSLGLDFWWRIGWVPVIISPYAWYIVILWYAGFWNTLQNPLRRRHRFWFALTSALAIFLVFLIGSGNPLPGYFETIYLDFSGTPAIEGIPVIFFLYPPLMIACIVLSMDALRRPEPAHRFMGDIARQRSRPWLMTTAVTLLIVSLLVTGFIGWVGVSALNGELVSFVTIVLFDLLMETLIALSIIFLGQAVVAYEVFTGKTLPRRGFARHWRNTLLIGAGVAALTGWELIAPVRPIYSLMLTALMMVGFYALYNWRSFVEREQFMGQLRPFVSSQHLFQHLLAPHNGTSSRVESLFHSVCRDVLGTTQAYLIPMGSLAPLTGSPLVYPTGAPTPLTALPSDMPESPNVVIVPLNREHYPDWPWAVPLWSERGRVGVLLLGDKQEGGLYTQEEIEIARSSGERIIDTMAGEEMARRLMELQRGRLAENQVMDRRTRRILHDETLPTLHTALLRLSSFSKSEPTVREAITSLAEVHQQIADLIHTARKASDPASNWNLTEALQRMVGDEFEGEFNSVSWSTEDNISTLDAITHEVATGAVREALRNAALHGRGEQPERALNLKITLCNQQGTKVVIEDDGIGFGNGAKQKRGSGNGLALHTTMLAIVGGYLTAEAATKGGTSVTITLPQTQPD